ncbi:MAG: periplasmic heavy metal sensor [Betaproteobacteria bacterium]|nr:periplasmic heavy metal sensor [Betaproteobacteria bacterium]
MDRKRGFWIALWVILVVVTGWLAFGYGGMGYGPGHGWGRMGAWGDGYRADGGQRRYGMGPGMMGGAVPGQGWGMGRHHGMMGQYGAGMGFGMTPTDLTSDQAQKIDQLQQEALTRNRDLAQQLWAAQDTLNRLHMNEKRDWGAIRAASQKLFDLQRQQLDAAIDLQQKIDGVLTDRQRRDMARSWRGHGWMGAQ